MEGRGKERKGRRGCVQQEFSIILGSVMHHPVQYEKIQLEACQRSILLTDCTKKTKSKL